jgi:hypothetical protein
MIVPQGASDPGCVALGVEQFAVGLGCGVIKFEDDPFGLEPREVSDELLKAGVACALLVCMAACIVDHALDPERDFLRPSAQETSTIGRRTPITRTGVGERAGRRGLNGTQGSTP